MATHRRYTKREKVAAIVAADASSTLAASEATGVPESTLRYWLDQPEFAKLRENAREAMAEEAQVVARLAWQKLGEAIRAGQLDGRDLVIAAGMATDKSALLNGQATARTEHRDIADDAAIPDAVAAARSHYLTVLAGPPAVGGGNGTVAPSNGHSAVPALRLPSSTPRGRITPPTGAEGSSNGHQPDGGDRGEVAG
jgi:transposase-like protein